MELNNATAVGTLMIAQGKIDELWSTLNSIISHWDEFGPEHGFDETIHRARRTRDFYLPAELRKNP